MLPNASGKDCPSCMQDRATLHLHTRAMQVVILYLFSICLIIIMHVIGQSGLCAKYRSNTGQEDLAALLHSRQMTTAVPPSSSLMALHLLLLLMAILLKRDDKASEKCTNWLQVLSSGMHSKTVAVGKYTSTSEQFSCQVQKGSGLSHYIYSPTCSHQGHLVREQKLNAMDTEVTASFVHPSLPSHTHISTTKIG